MPAPKRYRLTVETLRELLHYDEETGRFTWRTSRGPRAPAGGPAGSIRSDGYVIINIKGFPYSAARLAWLYVKGELPFCRLAYKDSDPKNLAFSNLVPVLDINKRDRRAIYNRNYYRARRNLLLHGRVKAPGRSKNTDDTVVRPFDGYPLENLPEAPGRGRKTPLWGNWDGRLETFDLPDDEHEKIDQLRALGKAPPPAVHTRKRKPKRDAGALAVGDTVRLRNNLSARVKSFHNGLFEGRITIPWTLCRWLPDGRVVFIETALGQRCSRWATAPDGSVTAIDWPASLRLVAPAHAGTDRAQELLAAPNDEDGYDVVEAVVQPPEPPRPRRRRDESRGV